MKFLHVLNQHIFHVIDLSSTADHSLKKSPAETSSQQESLVNGCVMRWPKFGVINSIYDGNYT